ncbi:hypothetical protein JHJ32_06930 [Parapedobacter sp. ISTM3]|uniref:glycosyl-4,4'-diaponeurosporenoate acyltransferase CrtO family protein n=1 Tax=Parapedobacter sp. ISTM3 TaxID=2800130 RepID=UPI0019066729|nr:hypothetical protein [Parapedobacter sp. ISTM3]MBK1439710.1 hypothetical protein [Parapedobacter sp. ISTM3]
MMTHVLYSFAITISSWTVGLIVNAVLSKLPYYKNLSTLNLLKDETLNKRIGLGTFKWIVKNTFFKYFNQKIHLKNKCAATDLNELRKEMTISEISHLVGFVFVVIIALMKFIAGNVQFGLLLMLVNVALNLYPSLLQQANKRRIDKLMA